MSTFKYSSLLIITLFFVIASNLDAKPVFQYLEGCFKISSKKMYGKINFHAGTRCKKKKVKRKVRNEKKKQEFLEIDCGDGVVFHFPYSQRICLSYTAGLEFPMGEIRMKTKTKHKDWFIAAGKSKCRRALKIKFLREYVTKNHIFKLRKKIKNFQSCHVTKGSGGLVLKCDGERLAFYTPDKQGCKDITSVYNKLQ